MDLTTRVIPTLTYLNGDERFTLAAGKELKIETSPDGEEILETTVPAGKSWEVTVGVSIVESTV